MLVYETVGCTKNVSDTLILTNFFLGTSAWVGDSGGSMTFKENDIYYIRGIVSNGPSITINQTLTCDSFHYVLFTDVTKYLPWIDQVTYGNESRFEKL